jgi:hypothetical protein
MAPFPQGCVSCTTATSDRVPIPRHLFLGTKRDNKLDKVSKGRQPDGERHHWAKLTWRQIELSRAMRPAGSTPMQQIACLFGVSRWLVSMILANKIWRSQKSTLVTA